MATYKVPQDVEADDKLIGPFSFRQFIYLIIVVLAIALAWGLSQVFIVLAIIPLPIILLFGALALPLRKDQPMEIYLAAIISYYLKPHKRLWDSDGIESLIEITVPKVIEVQRSKNITQADAEQRFSYLAGIVDSGGWAIRGAGVTSPSTTLNNDILMEAQGAEDVLDSTNPLAQSFNMMMTKETDRAREEAIQRMHAVTAPVPVLQPVQVAQPVVTLQPITSAYAIPVPATPVFNPYPTSIQQTVIEPVDDPAHRLVPVPVVTVVETPPTTSSKAPSADIINLANNPDLSIETIAREAHRIQQKEDDMSEEVIISLR